MRTKYKLTKGLGKGVMSLVLFAVPVLIDQFVVNMPQVANLTIGGLLVIVWNAVKFHYFRTQD